VPSPYLVVMPWIVPVPLVGAATPTTFIEAIVEEVRLRALCRSNVQPVVVIQEATAEYGPPVPKHENNCPFSLKYTQGSVAPELVHATVVEH